jgi:predicted type IV restriction endonuclease
MALKATLDDITAQLHQRKFPNEQAISQGIVLRLLHDLGWDTGDTVDCTPPLRHGN